MNEIDGSVEFCFNLIGQSDIDITLTFNTTSQSAIGMCSYMISILCITMMFE